VTGNAYSVPVVTAVFRQLLKPYMHPVAFGLPQMVNRPQGPVDWEASHTRMRQVNAEREQIALLEREAQLLERKRKTGMALCRACQA
jgi:hypothetical protein